MDEDLASAAHVAGHAVTGELMGFDYDLIRHFARQHDLRVRMVVRDSASQMFDALQTGAGDVIAGAMTITERRKAEGWRFSNRYL